MASRSTGTDANPREQSENSLDPLTQSAALYAALDATAVTPDHLRAVYEALAHRIECLGAVATEEDVQAAREQCVENIEDLRAGKLADQDLAVERLHQQYGALRELIARQPTADEGAAHGSPVAPINSRGDTRASIAPGTTADVPSTALQFPPPPPFRGPSTSAIHNPAPSRLTTPHAPFPTPTNPFPPPPPPHYEPIPPPSPPPSDPGPRVNPAVYQLQNRASLPPAATSREPAASYWHWGALVPGVNPLTTLIPEFAAAVDYRSYRLANTDPRDNQDLVLRGNTAKTVTRMRGLMPRLKNYNGKNPLALLTFLRELRQALNGVGLSEGAATRTISWFLEDNALQVYSQHTHSGIRATTAVNICWATVVNALLERYLTDDVIADAHNRVITAAQDTAETELEFADRLEQYADNCSGVYTDAGLTHQFLRGLLPTTRAIVAERVRQLPTAEQTNFSVVRRIANAEGTTYRARATAAAQVPSQPGQKGRTSRTPSASSGGTMYISNAEPTAASNAALLVAPGDHVLHPVLTIPATPTASSEESAEDTLDITSRIQKHLPPRLPVLTAEQVNLAQSIIPPDTSGYTCWLCRGTGHLMYTCPFLSRDQQLYCAYQNYRYQLSTRPHMRPIYDGLAAEARQSAEPPRNPRGIPQPRTAPRLPPRNNAPRVSFRGSPPLPRSTRPSQLRGPDIPRPRPREVTREVYDAVMTIGEAGWDIPRLTVRGELADVETPRPSGDPADSRRDDLLQAEVADMTGPADSSSESDSSPDSKKE